MTADPHTDPHALAAHLKAFARGLGFDLVGIAPAEPSAYRAYFRQWLDDGRAGTMAYLANRFAERTDVGTYLPGAASVICVAENYHVPLADAPPGEHGPQGKVARYALGDDYHGKIKQRLYKIADHLRDVAPGALTKSAVDSAPVLERELAARAGIGWLAKNTCIINERIGSWIFLGEVVTTLALPPDPPAIDRCGTCQRCLEACPTGALRPDAPYKLDASRCISYLTIEHRDAAELPPDLRPLMGEWLYGCDICQDVCPFNGRAPAATEPALQPRFPTGALPVDEVLAWDIDTFRARLRHSAMKRINLPILHRNARAVRDNHPIPTTPTD